MADGNLQHTKPGDQREQGKTREPDGPVLVKRGTLRLEKVPEHHRTGQQPEKGRSQDGRRVAAETACGAVINRMEAGHFRRDGSQEIAGHVVEIQVGTPGFPRGNGNLQGVIQHAGDHGSRHLRIFGFDPEILRGYRRRQVQGVVSDIGAAEYKTADDTEYQEQQSADSNLPDSSFHNASPFP